MPDSWHCPECGFAPPVRDGIQLFAPELAEADSGFDPRIVRGAQHSEESSFWFRARNRLIAWALRRDFPHARSLLEVGCGTGFVLMGLGLAAPDLRRRPRHVGLGRPLVPRWPLNTMLERVMNQSRP